MAEFWPTARSAETFAPIEGREEHELEVVLQHDGQLADVRLDGQSAYPTWFKIEFKETGEMSAKIKGLRLSTRYGDRIRIRQQ